MHCEKYQAERASQADPRLSHEGADKREENAQKEHGHDVENPKPEGRNKCKEKVKPQVAAVALCSVTSILVSVLVLAGVALAIWLICVKCCGKSENDPKAIGNVADVTGFTVKARGQSMVFEKVAANRICFQHMAQNGNSAKIRFVDAAFLCKAGLNDHQGIDTHTLIIRVKDITSFKYRCEKYERLEKTTGNYWIMQTGKDPAHVCSIEDGIPGHYQEAIGDSLPSSDWKTGVLMEAEGGLNDPTGACLEMFQGRNESNECYREGRDTFELSNVERKQG